MTEHAHLHESDAHSGLWWALLLAVVYMLAEAVGGWWSGSLALWADAGHMFSDSAGLALSLFAAWMSRRPGGAQQTFGLVRAEILAATLNGVLLVLVAMGIAWEAWERWQAPQSIDVAVMSGVALGGLFVNLLMLRLLHGGHEHNLNLRGAWLHVVGDLLGSVAVLIAATVIHRGWLWMDPLVSVLISLLIVASSWRLLKEAVSILMEHSPHTVQVDEVRRALLAQPAVAGVHCLHVWSIASGFHSISAHIVLQPGQERCELLADLRSDLQQKFAVEHVTLQLEPANFTGCDEGSANGCRVGSGKAVNHAADGCSRERTCDAQAAH